MAGMTTAMRWALGLIMAVMLAVVPFVYYRSVYMDTKRLRVVQDGVLYRSGQLSADGFINAFNRYGIRTVINAQDEVPDPDVPGNWFNGRTIKESKLCEEMGVRYVHLPPSLVSRRRVPGDRPDTIDEFLAIMDDPHNHPVLLHCRAGLHRTGVLAAVFRMEYEQPFGWGQIETLEKESPRRWTPLEAMAELKEHGFGQFFCTTANDYVVQYVLTYRPGIRKPTKAAE
jgi:tyrosine-protein phosphatase SIW14